jgi:hypothetical protein
LGTNNYYCRSKSVLLLFLLLVEVVVVVVVTHSINILYCCSFHRKLIFEFAVLH